MGGLQNYDELKWGKQKPLYCFPSNREDEARSAENPPSVERLQLNAETTALLVVDVQPEYWSNCPAVRKDFPKFEENLQRTIETARRQRAKIIWVRADYRHQHSPWLVQFERLSKGKRPDTMVELPCEPESETFGWESFATPECGEAIIAKSSWSSTSNTALLDMLRSAGIDTVLVCGLITSVCVQHSAFGVFEAGYRTLLVHDACGDRGKARHEAALALYGDYMYELISSKELANPENGLQMAKPVWITLDNSKYQILSDGQKSEIEPPLTNGQDEERIQTKKRKSTVPAQGSEKKIATSTPS